MGTASKNGDPCSWLRWIGPLTVLLAGTAILIWKIDITWPIRFLGLADPAAYAEMAGSLLSGRWLEVDYISMHFRRFDPWISHPEETWPPLYAWTIVPCFAILGKTAFAAKLPSLLISCIALPIATYGLARKVSRSGAAAVASAITVLLYEPLFVWSLYAMADLAFGFLVVMAVLFALKGTGKPRWFYAMGIALALAYYAKTATVILVPAFAAAYVCWRMLRRPRQQWMRRDRHFLLALCLMGLLVLPWLIRNTVHFGDPFYSTHRHVAGYVGLDHWEEKTLAVYWDKEPPSIGDKLERPGALLGRSLDFLVQEIRMLFLQKDARVFVLEAWDPPPFSLKDISTYGFGLPALIGLALLLFLGVYGGWLRRIRRRTPECYARHHRRWKAFSAFAPAGYLFFLFPGLAHAALICILWVPNNRYNTPLIPMVIIMGWGTLYTLFRVAGQRIIPLKKIIGVAVILYLALWSWMEMGDLGRARGGGKFPWGEGGKSAMVVADWIRINAPGSVIMTRHPWGFKFYSGQKTVQLPVDDLDKVRAVAEYYGVTHVVVDRSRPQLTPWAAGQDGLLRPLFHSGDLVLCEWKGE